VRFLDDAWGDEGTDAVPRYILCQAHTHMTVTGASLCHVPVLGSGNEYREYVVKRDPDFSKMLLEAVAKFDERVEKRMPPEPKSQEDEELLISIMHPKEVAPLRAATEQEALSMHHIKEAMGRKKGEDEIISMYKLELKKLIGDARGLESDIGKIVWTKLKDKVTTNWMQVAQRLSDQMDDKELYHKLIEEFTTRKPGARRFMPYWKRSK